MSPKTRGLLFILAGFLISFLSCGGCFSSITRGQSPGSGWLWGYMLALGLIIYGFVARKMPEKVPEHALEDRAHRTALLYHVLPSECGYLPPHKETTAASDLLPQLPKQLLNLPLPQFNPAGDSVTLKILPAGEGKPKVVAAFFEVLHRTLTAPLSFDLVFEQGTAYFQIICAAADQETVEQQLLIHFPGCVVEPHEPEFLHLSLNGYWRRYLFGDTANKTLTDFVIDPYAQLFSTLDELEDSATMLFRVLCAPLPNSTINSLVSFCSQEIALVEIMKRDSAKSGRDMLRLNHLHAKDEMLPPLIEHLEAKQPAWAMACGVLAVLPEAEERGGETAEDIFQAFSKVDLFFDQFEIENEQTWVYLTDKEWPDHLYFKARAPWDHALPYSIVACDELAALAHFPSPSVRLERLETATGAVTAFPPALYLEPE